MIRFCKKKVNSIQANLLFKKFLFNLSFANQIKKENAPIRHFCNNNTTNLSEQLKLHINNAGPISIAYFMKQVLTHPTQGYYVKNDVFGDKGDFTTSPEISQLFGEMIAVWMISEVKKIHRKPLQIVELGPGRGTLSRDILRVFNKLGMSEQISLHLVEISPVLSKIQKKVLCTTDEEDNVPDSNKYYQRGKSVNNVDIFWYKSIIDIPHEFSIFIAQEFFDALPIHKFQKTTDGWFEVLIDIDRTSENKDKFRYVLAQTPACTTMINRNEQRDHFEISPDSVNIIRYISASITEKGGFALIIDYGHNGDKTDTFRAFSKHKQCDPLMNPGAVDLTADVDFSILRNIAQKNNNLLCFGPVTQRDFLHELGIKIRLMSLSRGASPNQLELLQSGYNKIVDANEMGTCFKVLSMFPYVLKEHFELNPLPGFKSYHSS